jgi:MbtH protein
MSKRDEPAVYKVVVNHEEQYSIWPAHRENALGFRDAGIQGTKAECEAFIAKAKRAS